MSELKKASAYFASGIIIGLGGGSSLQDKEMVEVEKVVEIPRMITAQEAAQEIISDNIYKNVDIAFILMKNEGGETYGQMRRHSGDKLKSYLQGGTIGYDEYQLAQLYVNEKMEADGGWEFEPKEGETIEELLIQRIFTEVFPESL